VTGTIAAEVDFAVIGAGLAGLATAVALQAGGASVTVFEARDRVGGRVLSAPESAGGAAGPPLVLDLGAQWVGPGQTEVLRWIRELRLHLIPCDVPGRAIWDLDGHIRSGRAAFPPLPPRALADLLAGGVRAGIMARRISPDAPWQARKAAVWDRVTVADWIGRYLRTPAGRAYAEILVRGNAAIEPRETSMLNLLFGLRSTGSVRNMVRAESFRLREGTEELARRLADRVRDQIRFANPVLAVVQDSEGVTVESADASVRCRRVAVCVPPPLARKLSYTPELPPARAGLLAGMGMAASVKFHTVYRRPFWRDQGLSGQAMSATETVALTYDNSPADTSGRGVLVGLVVADQARRLSGLDGARREREILASLGRLLGADAAAPDAIVIQDWQHEQWTQGCYAAFFPPGGWTSYGAAFRAPSERIHWAGTETTGEWNGYMEGALRSGKRAAAEMLAADAAHGPRPGER
jgi:monoamine oxidase